MESPQPLLFKKQSPVHSDLTGEQGSLLRDPGLGFYLNRFATWHLDVEGFLRLHSSPIWMGDGDTRFASDIILDYAASGNGITLHISGGDGQGAGDQVLLNLPSGEAIDGQRKTIDPGLGAGNVRCRQGCCRRLHYGNTDRRSTTSTKEKANLGTRRGGEDMGKVRAGDAETQPMAL